MLPAYASTLWPGDPLAGVLSFGSGALVAWMLVAAMIGMLLASIREHAGDTPTH